MRLTRLYGLGLAVACVAFLGARLPARAADLAPDAPVASAAAAPNTLAQAAPSAAPTPAATLAPTPPPPARTSKERDPDRDRDAAYFVADVIPFELTYNHLAHGLSSLPSPVLRFSASFFHQRVMFQSEYRNEGYVTQGAVDRTAGGGFVFIPTMAARDYTIEERLGVRPGDLPFYIGGAVYYHPSNYGFPILVGGGFGLETLAHAFRRHTTYGRLYFYPNINNEHPYYDVASGNPLGFRYSELRGEVEHLDRIGHGPISLHYALEMERWWNLNQGPSNIFRLSPTVGFGLKF
jgi:hypothetical protein